MNTMADLRRVVATRLRQTLHGREIDLMHNDLQLEHMLGVVEIGESRSTDDGDGTILDPDHQFWQEWHSDALSGYYVRDKIQTAIHSLKKDGIFRLTYPHGEEAEIVYIEVDEMTDDSGLQLQTSCKECDTNLSTAPNLVVNGECYALKVSIDCPECGFSGLYQRRLNRL